VRPQGLELGTDGDVTAPSLLLKAKWVERLAMQRRPRDDILIKVIGPSDSEEASKWRADRPSSPSLHPI
jgi:hypothetical protein